MSSTRQRPLLARLLFLSAFQIFSLSAFAQSDALQRFREGSLTVATLAEVLPYMSQPEQRPLIRKTILEAKSPPREELVSLLEHPSLAVRLASLELLEELAGGDFSYNPWLPAEAPENRASFARWRDWAGKPATSRENTRLYPEEQRRSYLQDILGSNPDKASRARRMLEAEGLSAVGFLEEFLAKTPTLAPGSRSKIREAQYQITLTRNLGDQASITAHHLAFGSRDQLITALTSVRSAGYQSLPILRDFITHPDPLVRESAIDSLLLTGGDQAVPLVAPLLKEEADVNVIHGALRRLKDIPCDETENLVISLLQHPDEDLLVSTIQTAISLGGHDDNRKSTAISEAIVKTLKDPRWRVRAAALEFITKNKTRAAKECLALLDDPDEFVRFAAIKAVGTIGVREALPKLDAMFAADPSMAGPVLEGYGALEKFPGPDFLAKLDAAPADAKLAAIRAAETSSKLKPLVTRYAADPNLDVACAALRKIASDDESSFSDEGASLLATALQSGSPEKRTAILEQLVLPKSKSASTALLSALQSATPAQATSLDPLYDGFLLPGADRASGGKKIPAAQAELIRQLTQLLSARISPDERFRVAANLARNGHAAGYKVLTELLPTLNTAQKNILCECLEDSTRGEAIPLLETLLRDPVPEVRSAAANAALSDEKARRLIELVLSESIRPGSLLQASEIHGYNFRNAARRSQNSQLFCNWIRSALSSADAPTPLRVLALLTAQHAYKPSIAAEIERATHDPNPLIRRAAWYSLLAAQPSKLNSSAAAIAADPAAFVREALPNRAANVRNRFWIHRFSDSEVEEDYDWSYRRTSTRISNETREVLNQLATRDTSPLVRFEASFALLTHGEKIDLERLSATVPQLAESVRAPRRIADWLEDNAKRATPALAPLLSVADLSSISGDDLAILKARVLPESKTSFATFSALAQTETDTPSEPLLHPETDNETLVERTSLEAIYFYKPGCPECNRARQHLARLTREFPLLKVTEHNILQASGTVLNQALCSRFSVPSANHNVSPALFTQEGFLIRDAITPQALERLMAETMAAPQDDSWLKFEETEKVAASEQVERRFEAFTLPIVLAAGLLDGVNPCAFATIIFFLSYLQIARRTPREMLMVGVAFIIAVFIAYLAAGLLFHSALASLSNRFASFQHWMNIGFGGLALIAAGLSFRDAWLARSGRIADMTLQLPGFLKDRIRGVIRTGARARNFVIAAFVAGLVISLLELACTGQVYAPIIYQIQRGKLDAVGWLVLYNLAFIAPLAVIFLLAWCGMSANTLIAIQKKHTALVKTGLGLVFLTLALAILFGHKLIGG